MGAYMLLLDMNSEEKVAFENAANKFLFRIRES